jgi:hypothetical protein
MAQRLKEEGSGTDIIGGLNGLALLRVRREKGSLISLVECNE